MKDLGRFSKARDMRGVFVPTFTDFAVLIAFAAVVLPTIAFTLCGAPEYERIARDRQEIAVSWR